MVEITGKSDITDLKLTTIQQSQTVSVAGSVFFEGEESPKEHKRLYKEKPKLAVTIRAKSDSEDEIQKVVQLTESHLFEFQGLIRGQEYEITAKSSKQMIDLRH